MDVSSPGSSLAEWSQKIKDLQQQVDRDGLQGHERLEAEISRSRMERARHFLLSLVLYIAQRLVVVLRMN
jgi:hypothetical protein